MHTKIPKQFHSLDAIRGLAALAVVMFHYANFMTVGNDLDESIRKILPFHGYVGFFFEHGWLAVDLFFSLSGFIFFWLYSQRILSQQVSSIEFFILRFGRLYPLHFATLLLVAGLQLLYAGLHPELPFFQTRNNDYSHFLLHLVFASNWVPGFGTSFNSPIWSVSIEVLLYMAFFAICRRMRPQIWFLVLLTIMGWWAVLRYNFMLGRGIGSFFMGGLIYLAYLKLLGKNKEVVLFALPVLIWSIGLYGMFTNWSFLSSFLSQRSRYFPVVLMFPSLILTSVLIESRFGMVRSLDWLGNTSYSTYLIHFPLQLIFVLIVDSLGLSRSVFYSNYVFLLYFAVLLPLSLLCYYNFEKPTQTVVRSWMKGRRLAIA